jgi:D-galactarolactone cycloisomerase
VARVEAFALEAPLPGGGYGASTVRLPARIATLVKITTSDGVVGWGECFGPPRVLASLLGELAGPAGRCCGTWGSGCRGRGPVHPVRVP